METAEATALVRGWSQLEEQQESGPKGGRPPEIRVSLAKAKRAQDADVVDRKQDVANRYAYRKLVGVLFTNAERDAALISRELTRRTGSLEAKPRRENRWRP